MGLRIFGRICGGRIEGSREVMVLVGNGGEDYEVMNFY